MLPLVICVRLWAESWLFMAVRILLSAYYWHLQAYPIRIVLTISRRASDIISSHDCSKIRIRSVFCAPYVSASCCRKQITNFGLVLPEQIQSPDFPLNLVLSKADTRPYAVIHLLTFAHLPMVAER